jgi:hypothetical protein
LLGRKLAVGKVQLGQTEMAMPTKRIARCTQEVKLLSKSEKVTENY